MAVLHSFERARDLLVKGTIDCEAMLTHRFPLDSYTTAIDTFRKGTGLKVQVTPHGAPAEKKRVPRGAYGEQHSAEVPLRLHVAVRFNDVFKWEGRIHL